MSTDLIAALRAALDAEEATARVAAEQGDDPAWHMMNDGFDNKIAYGSSAPRSDTAVARTTHSAYTVHIVRHDPAFVLADIAAKRRILDLAEQLPKLTAATDLFDNGRDAWAEVIRTLAEAYGITTA